MEGETTGGVAILGRGGHARVLARILAVPGGLMGVVEPPMIGKGEDVPAVGGLAIGVGDVGTRRVLYETFQSRIISVWAPDVKVSMYVGGMRGTQYMRGVIIERSARIERNVLVNTGAQIDHDCTIGDHCVISPGAILCGNVTLGEACFIGAGAIIVQGVTLEPETFVPAGTLVVGPDDFRVPSRVVRGD